MKFRVSIGTLERSIVCSKTNLQSMQIVKKLKHSARAVRAENKRHWNTQAYSKYYPNLHITPEYYGIFRSGLLQNKNKAMFFFSPLLFERLILVIVA